MIAFADMALADGPAAIDDILIDIHLIRTDLVSYARISKKFKKRVLETLALAEQEITNLRKTSKPRVVKRAR